MNKIDRYQAPFAINTSRDLTKHPKRKANFQEPVSFRPSKQRAFLFAAHPEVAEKWYRMYGHHSKYKDYLKKRKKSAQAEATVKKDKSEPPVRVSCDICKGRPAEYDGRTRFGVWAFMCTLCFEQYGVGLGLGKGQKLK